MIRPQERGQGMVEYALILVLIAVVVIAVVIIFGHTLSNTYSTINSGVGTANG